MAQRLYEKHSPGMCVRLSKRHSRLCSQVQGAESLASAIAGAIAKVQEKAAAKRAAEEERDSCYDLILFHDADLDNVIRSTASRCKEYDRENIGARTYQTIFPENTSPIIETNPADEPLEVQKVVTRIQSLGSDHELFPLAEKLDQAAQKVNEAVSKHLDGISGVGAADAELQIAKAELIRQYMVNIFEAEKLFGRKNANRLFPSFKSSRAAAGESEEDDEE